MNTMIVVEPMLGSARERPGKRAVDAEARARFLAEASRILSSSFDYDTTLARFARLAVPVLGDFCMIDLVDGDNVRRVATAHADRSLEGTTAQLARFPPIGSAPANPIRRALDTRRTQVVGPEELDPWRIATDAEHRELLERLAPRSCICAPMCAQAELEGVVTFVSSDPSRVYSSTEISLAEDLAGRAALAVRNAHLFHRAEHATRARDEILAVVAHDLRDPLSVIRNAAEMMKEMDLDDRLRPYLAMITRSTQMMTRLISDLLEISRLESGTVALDLVTCRASQLVREAAAMLEPLAAAREIDLIVDAPPAEWAVRADDGRIMQVFSNLVGNAIKFTPPGGRIRVSTVDAGAEVRFEIADTGPGIPADQLPHVFGRFWRADSSDRRGIGLGLAIAKILVEAHDGRIWVESRPGVGTDVYFTLPRVETAPEPTPAASPHHSHTRAERRRSRPR